MGPASVNTVRCLYFVNWFSDVFLYYNIYLPEQFVPLRYINTALILLHVANISSALAFFPLTCFHF